MLPPWLIEKRPTTHIHPPTHAFHHPFLSPLTTHNETRLHPEVLNCPYKSRPEENKEKTHLHYDSTVDSWAVGVLAYELLVGCPPFYDQSREKVEARIRTANPVFPKSMSEDARSFVSAALTKDPKARPTVQQLLQHPFINVLRSRRSMRQLAVQPVVLERPAPQGVER